MLEIGSLVDGKYKILSKVGQGGMSVVYMAINEKANKTWAVKEVRKDGVLDFESVKQGLVAETDILKKLSHPYLPSIIDVIDRDDAFIIIMDYIQGNPLSIILREEGSQPQEIVVEWAKQLCDVLGYLHSRQPAIIYRDMKPSNIMLRPDGKITLIDFGTAREFKEKNLADTTCLGTIGYAAPEQFGGMGQTDARTDIYCLGATLYHVLTGCDPSMPPYEIRSIREVNPALSSGLDVIIQKCTQRNPDDRFQSAAELSYALEHLEENDEKYRGRQTRKLVGFCACAALSVACLAAGFLLRAGAEGKASETYDALVSQASMSSVYEEKCSLYSDAIAVPGCGGLSEAYLGLMQAYKDDSSLTKEEAAVLEKLIANHKDDILLTPERYAEICFEAGKLFWYYYDYGSGETANQVTRAKSAIPWFDDVIRYAGEDYRNIGMAKVYSETGKFYRDITTAITEADDKGRYLPFYENLVTLMSTVAQDDDETEIVRLELLELARSSIQQYVTKFKADGIALEDLQNILSDIDSVLRRIDTTTDLTEAKKENIRRLLGDTQSSVAAAYIPVPGGNLQ